VSYALLVKAFVPGGRVDDGTLILAVLGFVPGAALHAILSALPILAREPRWARVLAERWHLVLYAYLVSVVFLVELLLVSVLGLA
jgi:cytochrome b561